MSDSVVDVDDEYFKNLTSPLDKSRDEKEDSDVNSAFET